MRLPTGRKPKRGFVKGRRKTGGRAKGVPNKLPTELKEAIIEACKMIGRDGKGKQGLTGYLCRIAEKKPMVMGALLGKLLPYQLTGADGRKIEHEFDVKLKGVDLSKLSLEQLASLYQEALRTPAAPKEQSPGTVH